MKMPFAREAPNLVADAFDDDLALELGKGEQDAQRQRCLRAGAALWSIVSEHCASEGREDRAIYTLAQVGERLAGEIADEVAAIEANMARLLDTAINWTNEEGEANEAEGA